MLRRLGAALALGTVATGLPVSAASPLVGRRSDGTRAWGQILGGAAQAAPFNVYAATMDQVPDRVADLPPRVYVPHELGGDIAVIDPATMQIVDRFWVGRTPHHVTPSHDLSRLYVNVMDSNALVVIDPREGRPIGAVGVAVPYNLYFSPDGSQAVVAAEYVNRLDFYDPVTWEPKARVRIPGSGVDHLDFSADGSYLMVSCEFGGQVVMVELSGPSVVGVVRVGGLPIDVKVSPDGNLFYVANQGRHGVSVIDPMQWREVDFLPTGRGAHGLAISRDTRMLYVSNRLEGSITVVNFEAVGIAAKWWIGGSPDMLQVAPEGQLWASGRAHGDVYVVDTGTGQLLQRIRTGAGPHGLTYFPQPGRFCVGHNGVYR
jgi:DNA-binding beta-propeller fold protein YncE